MIFSLERRGKVIRMFGKRIEISEKVKKKGNSFSLSDIHMERVYELAQIYGISPSEVIRRAIDEFYFSTMERLSKIDNKL